MDVEQSLLVVRDVCVNSNKRYEHLEEALRKIEAEIQDIAHVIEFCKFNAYEGFYLARELQKVRNERRNVKNEMELLKPIIDLMDKQKPNENNLSRLIGDIRKIKSKHQTRSYRMRVRNDLEAMIK